MQTKKFNILEFLKSLSGIGTLISILVFLYGGFRLLDATKKSISATERNTVEIIKLKMNIDSLKTETRYNTTIIRSLSDSYANLLMDILTTQEFYYFMEGIPWTANQKSKQTTNENKPKEKFKPDVKVQINKIKK